MAEAKAAPQSCRAVTVKPMTKDSAALDEVPVGRPGPDEALLEVLEVGICGTDLEITRGLYGEPPAGQERLVLGHEALLRVLECAPGQDGLDAGSLCVPIVRRPCTPPCVPCAHGRADMCRTGRYRERGIRGLDGFMRERFVEQRQWLVPVPDAIRGCAVLVEPLSIIEKAVRTALALQERTLEPPARALVTGAGPVGLLATLLLRHLGIAVDVLDVLPPGPKSQVVEAAGARYIDDRTTPLEQAAPKGGYDLAVEASGYAPAGLRSVPLLSPNGALVLTGVSGGHQALTIDVNALSTNIVLENHLILGSVNASRSHYQQAVEDLLAWRQKFGDLPERLITARLPLARFAEALGHPAEAIKTVLEICA